MYIMFSLYCSSNGYVIVATGAIPCHKRTRFVFKNVYNYDNKGLHKKQIVFINPPFEDKHIKSACKLFRSRCMEGYLCLAAGGKWDYLELKDCFMDKLRKGGFVKSSYVFPCVEHKEKYTDLFCHTEGCGPKFDVRSYYIMKFFTKL